MELQTTPTPADNKSYKRFLTGALTIIIAIGGLYYGIMSLIEKDREIKRLNDKVAEVRSERGSCYALKDSLARDNARLSIYKTLSLAMSHRDDAGKRLSHRVGDVTYLKIDSTKVVIEDIIVGGNDYNYYIKYIVLFKDNSSRLINPDLVY